MWWREKVGKGGEGERRRKGENREGRRGKVRYGEGRRWGRKGYDEKVRDKYRRKVGEREMNENRQWYQ